MIDFSNEKANASSICLNQYSPHPHGMLELSIYECSCYHAAKVWPGQGQAAQQQLQWPVDHNTTHSVCSRATVGPRAPVSSLCALFTIHWRRMEIRKLCHGDLHEENLLLKSILHSTHYDPFIV